MLDRPFGGGPTGLNFTEMIRLLRPLKEAALMTEGEIRADERQYWASLAQQMAVNFRDPEGSQGSAHPPNVREKLAAMCDWFAENLRSPIARLSPAAATQTRTERK
jgi:hypothetical protein